MHAMNFGNIGKWTVFSMLKAKYPGYKNILIYPNQKKAMVQYKDGKIKEVLTGDTETKYFKILAESQGLERIDQIFLDSENDIIVIRGDKDVTL